MMLLAAFLLLHFHSSHALPTNLRQNSYRGTLAKENLPTDAGQITPVPIKEKPLGDPRNYQSAVLANGLQVINIQDTTSLQSAMAMGVKSGTYNEPAELEGLAHFCEHMLFLGSKKFPDASQFDEFINRHGGSNNAFTSNELTDYFFQAKGSAAFDNMQRFADWFSEPLFNRTYVEKEVHAIDSEHKKNMQDPQRRVLSTLDALANPESPVSRFGTGSVDTLITEPKKKGIDTVDALRKYFEGHYCPEKLSLVTFGSQSLSEQFEATQAAFGKLKKGSDSCKAVKSWAEPAAWPKDRLGKWVNIMGTTPQAELWLMFPTQVLEPLYASRPDYYLEYVFQYRGMNSLAKVLDDALGLASETQFLTQSSSASGQAYLVLALTPTGRENQGLVMDVVFSYIAALRQAGADPKLYESLKDLSKLAWDWGASSEPMDTVSSVAEAMTYMSLPDVIWGGAVVKKTDITSVNSMLAKLSPENMIVAYVAPAESSPKATDLHSAKTNTKLKLLSSPPTTLFAHQKVLTLPHYGVEYSVQPLASVLPGSLEKWQGWMNGSTSLDKIRSHINNTKTLSSIKVTSLSEFPEPPKPIVGIPKSIPLDNMHAKKLSGKTEVGSTEAMFGPLPTHLSRLKYDSAAGVSSREIWYRRGWVTKSPKVQISVQLRPLTHEGDPETSAQKVVDYSLYSKLLDQDLTPRLVDLIATGVSFSVSTSRKGLGLTFTGFTPNMPLLIKMALGSYGNFTTNGLKLTPPARFDRAKQLLRESLQTYSDMPMTYAVQDRGLLLDGSSYSNEELLEALDLATLSSAISTGANVTSSKPVVLTALSMGNLPESEAVKAIDSIQKSIPGASLSLEAAEKDSSGYVERVAPVVKPAGPIELRKLNPRAGDPNDVVIVSVLHGVGTPQDRVIFAILGDILQSVAYEELRTQRQLGYVVNAGTIQLSNVLGISTLVQGVKLKADAMEGAVEAVYHNFMPEKLASLTDDEFKTYVHSFKQGLMEPPQSQADEFDTFWSHVKGTKDGVCFHLRDEMLRILSKTLTSKQVLIDQWNALMAPSSGERTKIVVKYFAGEVPPRPTNILAKAMFKKEGIPAQSIDLLDREHLRAAILEKADSTERAKLRKAGGQYPTELVCKQAAEGDSLDETNTKSSSARIELRGVCLLLVLGLAFLY